MLLPAAPRATHGGNSKFTSSGTKFVSHWWRPGFTCRNSPSPSKYFSAAMRSGNWNELS